MPVLIEIVIDLARELVDNLIAGHVSGDAITQNFDRLHIYTHMHQGLCQAHRPGKDLNSRNCLTLAFVFTSPDEADVLDDIILASLIPEEVFATLSERRLQLRRSVLRLRGGLVNGRLLMGSAMRLLRLRGGLVNGRLLMGSATRLPTGSATGRNFVCFRWRLHILIRGCVTHLNPMMVRHCNKSNATRELGDSRREVVASLLCNKNMFIKQTRESDNDPNMMIYRLGGPGQSYRAGAVAGIPVFQQSSRSVGSGPVW